MTPHEWVPDVELAGYGFRLSPAQLHDAAELAACCHPDTFAYYVQLQPIPVDEAGFRTYLQRITSLGNVRPFTVRSENGQVLGGTTLMDIRPEARGLEIGMTWYATDARGTKCNPACKLLLLTHAFEELGAMRVQLKCDAQNATSRAAILKLGAKYEGTLRQHGIRPSGIVRDTAMFSILESEWSQVKDTLQARLT